MNGNVISHNGQKSTKLRFAKDKSLLASSKKQIDEIITVEMNVDY